MFGKCKAEYDQMMARLDQVIRDKWPEALGTDGDVWRWLDETCVEKHRRLTDLRRQLEVAWLNGIFDEMKSLTLEWGKLTLEIFREYALHLKRTEAA